MSICLPSIAAGVVGGDISGSGREVLIKTLTAVYHWYRIPGGDLWGGFEGEPTTVPYVVEPQGEAVAWAADSAGYYAISEERGGKPAHVYFYPRVDIPPGGVEPRGRLITTWGVLKRP